MTTAGVFWQLEIANKVYRTDTVQNDFGFKSFKTIKAVETRKREAMRFVMLGAKWERSAT